MKVFQHIYTHIPCFILSLGLILITSVSCNNFLEEDVVSKIGNQHIKTAKGFEDAVNAAYQGLRKFYGSEIGMTMTELGTDTFTNGSDGSFKHYNQYTALLDPRDAFVQELWTQLYISINTTNEVIALGGSVEGLNTQTVEQRIAEAKALRAHYYFILVQFYGGLDLRLIPTLEPVTAIERSTEDAVYTQIIKDMGEAAAVLAPTNNNWGRYTKVAAENMLAKIYLTRAGLPFGKKNEDYAKAAALGKKVITDYGKGLLPDFANLWKLGNDQHNEAIFSVQYSYDLFSAGDDGNRFHLFYLMEYDVQPGLTRVTAQGRPWKRARPTDYIYNEALVNREVDARYDKSFVKTFFATKTGSFKTTLDKSKQEITLQEGDTAIFMPGYEMTAQERSVRPYQVYTPGMYGEKIYGTLIKFLDPGRATVQEAKGGRDFMVSRLADTYLMVAEALIQQNKKEEAVDFINAVRKRAAHPGMEAKMEITDDQATMDMIYNERARELLGEMHRWFDLKRWGKLVERVKAYNKEGGPNIKEYHVYRPIPQIQIDRTDDGRNKFPQNSGYN